MVASRESRPDLWAQGLVGTVLAERYVLHEPLGGGAYAVVFRGTHTWTERDVAVKVLRADVARDDATAVRRFLREAKAAASLPHRHIVDVLDMGEQNGAAFLVLELLQGEPLSERLHRDGRLTLADTLRIIAPLLDALQSAHGRGFIHRDVKAENIFLHVDEHGMLIPKLLDFGTVKAEDTGGAPLTAQGDFLGTIHYMAPEQVVSRPVTPAADQFAIGVLLFRMLAGAFPFNGINATMVLADIVTKPTPPLDGQPEGVALAIAKALEKDAAGRHRDMHALLDALLAGAERSGVRVPDPRVR